MSRQTLIAAVDGKRVSAQRRHQPQHGVFAEAMGVADASAAKVGLAVDVYDVVGVGGVDFGGDVAGGPKDQDIKVVALAGLVVRRQLVVPVKRQQLGLAAVKDRQEH